MFLLLILFVLGAIILLSRIYHDTSESDESNKIPYYDDDAYDFKKVIRRDEEEEEEGVFYLREQWLRQVRQSFPYSSSYIYLLSPLPLPPPKTILFQRLLFIYSSIFFAYLIAFFETLLSWMYYNIITITNIIIVTVVYQLRNWIADLLGQSNLISLSLSISH